MYREEKMNKTKEIWENFVGSQAYDFIAEIIILLMKVSLVYLGLMFLVGVFLGILTSSLTVFFMFANVFTFVFGSTSSFLIIISRIFALVIASSYALGAFS